jgi:hypothetical protein
MELKEDSKTRSRRRQIELRVRSGLTGSLKIKAAFGLGCRLVLNDPPTAERVCHNLQHPNVSLGVLSVCATSKPRVHRR